MLLKGGVRRGTRLAFRSLLFTVVPPGYVWLTSGWLCGPSQVGTIQRADMFNY